MDYDLIDDEALAVTAAERYRVIIIVTGNTIPETTADWLDHVRASGGTVLTIDSATELTDALVAAVHLDRAMESVRSGLPRVPTIVVME